MKKAAVLSMAAFYLLLTTGMFVCIVYCIAENLVASPGMHMAGPSAQLQRNKKPCTKADDCGCCKKRGNYTIKENIKPGFDFQFSQTVMVCVQTPISNFLLQVPTTGINVRTTGKSPPGISGKNLSVQFRSLRI